MRILLILAAVLLALPAASLETVWGQASGGAFITQDVNNDGLYETVRFPADFDEDGTTWTLCTALRTPDDACPYAGFRLWTDFADDINAAQDKSNVGVKIYFEEGGYVTRVAVCEGGTRDGSSCSADADCTGGGACDVLPTSGYDPQYTYPSGALRSVASATTMHVPVLNKSGSIVIGAGVDLNAFTDGVLTGSWIIDDLGWGTDTDGTDPGVTLEDWSFAVGTKPTGCGDNTSFGECPFDSTLGVSGLAANPDTADGLLCVCNTTTAGGGCSAGRDADNADWATTLAAGDFIWINGAGYTDNANTPQNDPILRVIGVGGTCDSGAGILVRAHDGSFDESASLSTLEVYRIDPKYISADIQLSGFNFVPQNPAQQNGYGPDWPLADSCGTFETGQDGSANGVINTGVDTGDPADFDPDCDTGSSIGIMSGYKHQIHDNAFHHSMALGPGTIDGADGCVDCAYRDNYLGPTSVVSSMFDSGTGWEIHDNLFEGCAEYNVSTGSCFRTLGDNARIYRNRFFNIGMGRCTDDRTLLCENNNDCSGSCDVNPDRWGAMMNGENWFTDNLISGLMARFGMNVSASDLVFSDNRVQGVSGDTPIFMYVDPTGSTVRDIQIRDNTFRFMKTRGSNNAWVSIVQDTGQVPQSISITGNRFIASEDADSAANQQAPIRMGTGSTEVASHADYEINGNIIFGYDVLGYAEVTPAELETPLPPGWRRNIFNDVMLTERGGDTYANVISGITCNISVKGDAYTITDSDSCTVDTAGVDAQCYCDGSAWTDRP